MRHLRARVEQYYDRNPELADWMETNLPKALRSFVYARSTWPAHSHQQRAGAKPSDSPATRVVGSFPNTESALRLITAVVEEIHEDWLIGKQYLSAWSISNRQENPLRSLQSNSVVASRSDAKLR